MILPERERESLEVDTSSNIEVTSTNEITLFAESSSSYTVGDIHPEYGECFWQEQFGADGDNLTATLFTDGAIDETLVITGTGNAPVWGINSDAPWYFRQTFTLTSGSTWEHFRDSTITRYIIEDGVNGLGGFGVMASTELREVKIADTVSNMKYAFFFYGSAIPNLKEIKFPKSYTTDGIAAVSSGDFYGLTIILPGDIKSVDGIASSVDGIKSIVLEEGTERLESWAFEKCSGLEYIYIPSTVDYIDPRWYTEYINNNIEVHGMIYYDVAEDNPYYCSENGVLYNKDKTKLIKFAVDTPRYDYVYLDKAEGDGFGVVHGNKLTDGIQNFVIPDTVTEICDYAFEGCTALKSIEIPSSVTKIGTFAFAYCSSLDNVNIPNSVTSIGSYAFSGCTSLTNVSIPDSITKIWNSAFDGCSALDNVVIPNSITAIWGNTFRGCKSLANISIPDSVTVIHDSAFQGCTSLQEFGFPSSLTTIGKSTFSGCTSLGRLDLPSSLTSIGDSAFQGCTKLSTVDLTNTGVTSLASSVFSNCTSLVSIDVSNIVQFGGSSTFSGCSSLKSIQMPANVNYYSGLGYGLFKGCSNLESIEIPQHNRSIGNYCFDGCTKITEITLSSSETSIGDYAFRGTQITELRLPNTITSIGKDGLTGASKLTDVYIDQAKGARKFNYPEPWGTPATIHWLRYLKVWDIAEQEWKGSQPVEPTVPTYSLYEVSSSNETVSTPIKSNTTTVEYSNNTERGTADVTVTVTATGEVVTGAFTIGRRNCSHTTIDTLIPQEWTGNKIYPTIIIKDKDL